MLIMQAENLSKGEVVQTHQGDKISFLAGPFRNTNQAVWFIVARDAFGIVHLHNLNNLTGAGIEPEADQIWREPGDVRVKIIEVTPTFVIFKSVVNSNTAEAQVMEKSKFVKSFFMVEDNNA
jgi:hypothetical protein